MSLQGRPSRKQSQEKFQAAIDKDAPEAAWRSYWRARTANRVAIVLLGFMILLRMTDPTGLWKVLFWICVVMLVCLGAVAVFSAVKGLRLTGKRK